TSQISVVEAAIASLSARATFRLRKEQLLARSATVFLSTNRHKPGYQRLSRSINFRTPTADTGLITAQLMAALEPIFNTQASYHRTNVLLHNLISQRALQVDFFGEINVASSQAAIARLSAFDALNIRYGRNTIRYAAEDLSDVWEPKHGYRSPRYTSAWDELPVAHVY
ncbi:MAG TPA: DUF4113 domain-containing protein, partial [Verrucomicrobiae bacterium]|nr:DUF4113 domain-containing protein [Verrucomicrobiae bacterium]